MTPHDLTLFNESIQHDHPQIAHMAEEIIAHTELHGWSYGLEDWEIPERFAIEVFLGSVIAYTREYAPVDEGVEHDIPSWIEGNAPVAAEARLNPFIPNPSDSDIDQASMMQQHAWEQLWSGIQLQITAFLDRQKIEPR